MINKKQKGDVGEKIAVNYLKTKGYRILHKNFKTDLGEIDIVITDEEYLIFVEVKSRTSIDKGYPSESVTFNKRKKINQVASQYIKKFMLYNINVRFDVIEIYLDENRINHIENAFDSYLKY